MQERRSSLFIVNDPNLMDPNQAMIHKQPEYPSLPKGLKNYHYYIHGCGHVIMAVPTSLADDSKNLDMREAAAPVKYVLEKGYEIKNGCGIIDAPYAEFGIEIENIEKYEEF